MKLFRKRETGGGKKRGEKKKGERVPLGEIP